MIPSGSASSSATCRWISALTASSSPGSLTDEHLEVLAGKAGLVGDRLDGLPLEAAQQAPDEGCGMVALLLSIEQGGDSVSRIARCGHGTAGESKRLIITPTNSKVLQDP